MRVLSIDPGMNCGWALLTDSSLTSGVWRLGSTKGARVYKFIKQLKSVGEVDIVAFEDVKAHANTVKCKREKMEVQCPECKERHLVWYGKGTRQTMNVYAAHLYGAFKESIYMCNELYLHGDIVPVHVATAKKFATGNGRANKQQVIAAMKKRFPNQHIEDDNQADALAILLTACDKKGVSI